MAHSATLGFSVLRALLVSAVMAGAFTSTAAFARVGVTSATDGDPLGRPPAEPERILRIGIDVQANEVVTTGTNDRAHLVFLDGTSLTVGPNAQVTIDKFVYDPTTKTGELAINSTKGVLRLVGGKISKTNAITVTTPASTIGIRGGICLFEIDRNHTTSTFAFGYSMTVTGQGHTETITRPGFQLTTNFGSPPGRPTPAGQGLGGQLAALEGHGSGSGGSGGSGGGGSQGGNADQGAQGFSQQNSGQGPGGGPTGGPQGSGPSAPGNNPGNNPNLNNVTSAISGSNQQSQSNSSNQSSDDTTPSATPTPTPEHHSDRQHSDHEHRRHDEHADRHDRDERDDQHRHDERAGRHDHDERGDQRHNNWADQHHDYFDVHRWHADDEHGRFRDARADHHGFDNHDWHQLVYRHDADPSRRH